jgi:ferric-dicitrate binding protein FerR (iron transport regulator)
MNRLSRHWSKEDRNLGKANGQQRLSVKTAGGGRFFRSRGKRFEKNKAGLDKNIAWKSGKLMFRDDPMGKVIEKLGRWYGVEFQLDDRELLKYTYSATFSTESLDQTLKMLSLSAPIRFEFLPKEEDTDIQIIQLTKK